jgi:hypothetical protein
LQLSTVNPTFTTVGGGETAQPGRHWDKMKSEMIDDEQKARRLARAIVSDLRLYNKDRIASGADLTSEIEEGRQLFKSRVSGAFHAVFESEAQALRPSSAVARPLPPATPAAMFDLSAPPTPPASNAPWIVIGSVALAAVAVALWWIAQGR